jgi:hypothetical protein
MGLLTIPVVGVMVWLGWFMAAGVRQEMGGGRRRVKKASTVDGSQNEEAVEPDAGDTAVPRAAEWCVTVVLCRDGLPTLEEWNAEMADKELEVAVQPAPPDLAARNQTLVWVRGAHIAINFVAAPMESKEDWFPAGRLLPPDPKGAARIGWPARDARGEAAAWAMASALAMLSGGDVFVGEGVGACERINAWAALRRATALLEAVPPIYNDGEFDVEASTEALKERMLWADDELRRLRSENDNDPRSPKSGDREAN